MLPDPEDTNCHQSLRLGWSHMYSVICDICIFNHVAVMFVTCHTNRIAVINCCPVPCIVGVNTTRVGVESCAYWLATAVLFCIVVMVFTFYSRLSNIYLCAPTPHHMHHLETYSQRTSVSITSEYFHS